MKEQNQKIIDEMSVEECIQGIEKLDICCNRAEIVREKAKQLLEKQIPKKLIKIEDDIFVLNACPICENAEILGEDNLGFKHCPNCGQALDWSNE